MSNNFLFNLEDDLNMSKTHSNELETCPKISSYLHMNVIISTNRVGIPNITCKCTKCIVQKFSREKCEGGRVPPLLALPVVTRDASGSTSIWNQLKGIRLVSTCTFPLEMTISSYTVI